MTALIKNTFVSSVLVLLSNAALASPFAECKQSFFQGYVPAVKNAPNQLRALCFTDFAVMHSGETKTPVYTAEFVSRSTLTKGKDLERTDRFYEEARLPSKERATLEDYRGSGFDRGHMANARQRSSDQAMAQSFSLANMVPQAPGANRGSWSKSVEQASRNYAMKTAKGVYIYTGPLYEAPVKKLGKGKVWVPSATFKLMYDPSRKAAWGWILENKDDAKIKGVVSYEAMVKRTGIEFLPKDAVKN